MLYLLFLGSQLVLFVAGISAYLYLPCFTPLPSFPFIFRYLPSIIFLPSSSLRSSFLPPSSFPHCLLHFPSIIFLPSSSFLPSFLHLPPLPSFSFPICLSICLSIYLSISIYLYIYLSIYLCIYLFV